MALILNIETSTKNCSVSLADKGELLGFKEINTGGYSHAEKLHPLIEELMLETKKTFNDLNAVAVSKGPGSYTGLRIGVSAAKGICFSKDIPLISLNSLTILSQAADTKENEVIISLLDARRMEVYSAVFNSDGNQIRETKAEIIDVDSFSEYLFSDKVILLGDGAEKCKEILTSEKFEFLDGQFPSATKMASLSYQKYANNELEDVAYFEPFYLKDFVVTPEKKK